jgi:hypothetical protein
MRPPSTGRAPPERAMVGSWPAETILAPGRPFERTESDHPISPERRSLITSLDAWAYPKVRPWPQRPGGEGQLTVEGAHKATSLRKVPTPGVTGAGGNPPGESPSHGAETTQPDGTVKAQGRRIRPDLVKRPTSREQALSDGMTTTPRPLRRARSRMLPRTEWGLLARPGPTGERSPVANVRPPTGPVEAR